MSVLVSAYVRVPSTRDLVNGSIPITLYYNICLFIQSCLLMSFYCIIITINRDDDVYRNVLYVCTYKKENARTRFIKFRKVSTMTIARFHCDYCSLLFTRSRRRSLISDCHTSEVKKNYFMT